MRRKLVKQGQNALTLTLPSKWVKSQSLSAGNELEVLEQGTQLLLKNPSLVTPKRKVIQVQHFEREQIRSSIASAYKAGYTQIDLISKEEIYLKDLNKIINSFTGLEVISHGKKTIKIKCYLAVDSKDVDALIIKLFQTTVYLANEIQEQWESLDQEYLTDLVKVNNMKLRDHCLRAIHSTKFSGDKSYDYYDLVTIIEKITVELFYLSQTVHKEKRIPLQPTYIIEIKELIDLFYRGYLKKDVMVVQELWTKIRKEYQERIPKYAALANTKIETEMLLHYHHILKLLRHLSSRLVSIKIQDQEQNAADHAAR